MRLLQSIGRILFGVLIASCLLLPSYYSVKAIKEADNANNQLKELYDNEVNLLMAGMNQDYVQKQVILGLLAVNDRLQESIKKPSYEYLKNVTVIIYQPISEDEGSMGTGVVIKQTAQATYILTNKHVCDINGKTCEVILKNEGGLIKIPALVYKQIQNDYDAQILITLKQVPGKIVIKGFSTAHQQDSVYMVGHHLGRPYIYGEGVFAGYESQNIDVIQIPSLWGDSGSGVFNKNGELVALMFAINIQPFAVIFPIVDTSHGLAIDGAVLQMLCKGVVDGNI